MQPNRRQQIETLGKVKMLPPSVSLIPTQHPSWGGPENPQKYRKRYVDHTIPLGVGILAFVMDAHFLLRWMNHYTGADQVMPLREKIIPH